MGRQMCLKSARPAYNLEIEASKLFAELQRTDVLYIHGGSKLRKQQSSGATAAALSGKIKDTFYIMVNFDYTRILSQNSRSNTVTHFLRMVT